MFNKEVADKGVEKIQKYLEEKGFKFGLLYKADKNTEVVSQNQNGVGKKVITEVVFVPEHFRFEAGMHLDVVLCSNRNEVETIHFYFSDDLPEPAAEYKLDTLNGNALYDIADLDKFVSDFGVKEICKEVYLQEKATLERRLAELTDMMKNAGIEA